MQLSEIIRRATKEYVVSELNLDAGKQRNVPIQDLKNLEAKVEYRRQALQAIKNNAAIPSLIEKMEAKDHIIKDLCDDFVDFATSGMYNLAPYCANRTNECVQHNGWCKTDSNFCKGFYPKAAMESEN